MSLDCVIYSRDVCMKSEGLVNFGIVGLMFVVLKGGTANKRGAITVFCSVFLFKVCLF